MSGSNSAVAATTQSDLAKWFLYGFLVFATAIAAVTMATGFPNGGSILLEAGTVVDTPALCAGMPECHQFGSTLNQRGGVSFVNLPESYAPGASYQLGLEITGTAQTRFYGFQLAVFFQDDMRQAGSLSSATPNVQAVEFGDHQVLTHLDRLESGSVVFSWTAPAAVRPVVFRVASNSADGNGTNTGDHINTLDAVVPGQAVSDADGDGVDDTVEDGSPNAGDGNGDGIADRLQGNVASLPAAATGDYVTLAAPPGTAFAGTGSTDSPPSGETPLGVDFPLGFWTFDLGAAEGGSSTVDFLPPASASADAYHNYGPTPDNPAPHWYEFSFDGDTGAEITGDRIILHYRDGARGDHDLTVDGQISTLGGPALTRRILYFPQIAVGVADGSEFRTELVFVNAATANSTLRVEFFDSAAAPLELGFSINGAPSGPASVIDRPLAAGGSLRVLLSDPGAARVGYARVWADSGVGGTAVFSLEAGGRALYQAGVPATEALCDFSLAAGVSPGADTGLALVNASQGPGMTASEARSARVTLRLYDEDFNLLDTMSMDLAAGAHLPRFVTQFFPSLLGAPDFFGSVAVESEEPLAAVTLRLTTAPTLTTFPVVPGRADSGN